MLRGVGWNVDLIGAVFDDGLPALVAMKRDDVACLGMIALGCHVIRS